MQPNEQPSDLGQPVPPPVQQPPVVPPQPVQPVQAVPSAQSPIDPAALQSALNQPVPDSAPPQVGTVADGEPEGADVDEDPVTWNAHESIHHEKGATWFVVFTALMVVLLGLSIWTQAWSFAVLIVVITIVVFIYSKRPPRELTYSLTNDGLTVDGRLHDYDQFKSFGVIQDGEALSVMLIPNQRFQPGLTVYFPEESGEDIVDVLGSHLPMKELHLDMFDRVARMLRL